MAILENFIRHLKLNFQKTSRLEKHVKGLPSGSAIAIDLNVFLSSQAPQQILRFLHLPGGSLSYSPDEVARNLRVSNFWKEQGERKDKCYSSTYKGKIYKIAVSYN